MWHEDFADEPSVEERTPFGISPDEAFAAMMDASLATCEFCRRQAEHEDFIETGMNEYYTMDLDPGTMACYDCLEQHRARFIPDDPLLFDAWTPVAIS